MTLQEICFQRSKAKREAARLLDTAVAESRSLSIAEQVRFDSLTAKIEELDVLFIQRESLRKAAQ